MSTFFDKIAKMQAALPPAADAGIFGGEFTVEEAGLVLIPCPWAPTTSYGQGTHLGPQGILQASFQLDLYDEVFGEVYRQAIVMEEADLGIASLHQDAKSLVDDCRVLEGSKRTETTTRVNKLSDQFNQILSSRCNELLNQSKNIAVIGGDHSCPFALIEELGKRHSDFGVLHFDAHFDLRKSYEGFAHSHASIMYNVSQKVPSVSKFVHVGIRDYCLEELNYQRAHSLKHILYSSTNLFAMKAQGRSFASYADEIIGHLPEMVYVSFDIDGLMPHLCPGTGTPVPGGFEFEEACYILADLKKSGRRIIGFDLCEVAGSEWDYNVGARLLYKLCALFDRS